MNNSFSLSFGISLIIVGLLNVFFDTNNIILFGLSLSAMSFALVNLIMSKFSSRKLELLYIIPFILLISIFCYSESLMNISIISKIVNGKTTDILTFISFGFLFVSSYWNFKEEKLKNRIYQQKLINENLEYSALILTLESEYLQSIVANKKTLDGESEKFFNKIKLLCNEKVRQSKINNDLLELNRDYYSIQDFNKIYKKHNETINIYNVIKNYEKETNVQDNNN